MWNRETVGGMIVGVGLMIAAAISAGFRLRWIRQTRVTAGQVVGVEKREDSEGGDWYVPTIEFTTDSGAKQVFTSSTGSGKGDWKTGQQVSIRYDPADPSKAAINRFIHLFLLSIVLGMLGLIFTICVACAVAWSRKPTR